MKAFVLFLLTFSIYSNASDPVTNVSPLYALSVTVSTDTPAEEIEKEVLSTKLKLQESVLFGELRAREQEVTKKKSKIKFSFKKINKAMTIILKPFKSKVSKRYGIKRSLLKKLQVEYPELTKKELKEKIITELQEIEEYLE